MADWHWSEYDNAWWRKGESDEPHAAVFFDPDYEALRHSDSTDVAS